jgi:hypothetical protein
MKLPRLPLVLLLGILAVLASAPTLRAQSARPEPAERTTGVIEGRVFNAANGVPANTYNYQAKRLRVGLNAQDSFTPKFALFGSINNINGRGFVIGGRRYAADPPDYMRQRRRQQFGATAIFGVKGEL